MRFFVDFGQSECLYIYVHFLCIYCCVCSCCSIKNEVSVCVNCCCVSCENDGICISVVGWCIVYVERKGQKNMNLGRLRGMWLEVGVGWGRKFFC